MVNNQRELIKTTDREKKDRLVKRLVNAGISYLEKWEKVSFFRRREFNGAKEVCVILVNDHQMEKAMAILEEINSGAEDPGAGRKKIKALLDREKKTRESSASSEDEFFDDEDQ